MSVGLNKHIDFTIGLLQDSLWTTFNNSYNGRSFRIKKGTKVEPYIYSGNNEYNDVFTTDKYDAIVHFDVDPSRSKINHQQVNAAVNIIFAVNLGKIYGSDTRATEEAHNDVIKIINNTAFSWESIITDIDALSDYDLTPDEEHKFNMQPYYVFKLECTCNYALNTICLPEIPQIYTIDLSSGEGGTATSSLGVEGVYSNVAKDSLQAFNANADTGYRFIDWTINTLTSLINPLAIRVVQNYNIVANFIKTWELTTSVSGNGTITPESGTYDDGDLVTITAEPNDPETDELDRIEVNNTVVSSISPYTLLMDGDNDVIAYFQSILTVVLDSFMSLPVYENGKLLFKDTSSNGNDLVAVDSYWWQQKPTMTVHPSVTYDIGAITEYTLMISCYLDDIQGSESLLGGFSVIARPNKTNKTITFFGGDTVVAVITLDEILNTKLDIAFSTKSGGSQKIYINGVKVSDVAANTFTKSGNIVFSFGSWIDKANAKFWNYKVWNKQLSDDDVIFDHNNPYLTAFGNPTFSQPYEFTKDILVLWWRMACGYSNPVSSSNVEYDASGNNRNTMAIVTNDDTVGWQIGNPYYHANLYYGCTLNKRGVTIEYPHPFTLDRKPTAEYETDPSGSWRKHLYPIGFIQCESKVCQKNLGLPDYDNFWYDELGQPNKKAFSDFPVSHLNNQLFFDISEKFKIKRTAIVTPELLDHSFVNEGKALSNNLFIFGDSMPGSLAKIYNEFKRNTTFDTFAKISNVGGQHSYQAVNGWLDNGVSILPLDIKTRYPDNPNGLWTGFDTVNNPTVPAYLSGLLWESDYYQVVWFGTNNPTNLYVGTPDYLQMHYRLPLDLDDAYALNTNTDKKGCIIMHGNIYAPTYNEALAAYQAKALSYGYDFIDPKIFFSDIYKVLIQDSTDHPVIEKLIELDTKEQYIKVINGKVYIYNNAAARTNALGQPLDSLGNVIVDGQVQGKVAKWVNLSENTPNTLITIDSVEYDVFNANLVSTSITNNPFILDDPETWPSSLHSDGIHTNTFASALIVTKLIMFKE